MDSKIREHHGIVLISELRAFSCPTPPEYVPKMPSKPTYTVPRDPTAPKKKRGSLPHTQAGKPTRTYA